MGEKKGIDLQPVAEKPTKGIADLPADHVQGLRQDRIPPLVLSRVFGKRGSARLNGSKSVETMKEVPKVTSTEVEWPTELAVTASQVKAEQYADDVEVEQKSVSVKEHEPSSNQILKQPDELR